MTLFGLCAQDYFSRAGHELLDWLGFIFDPADVINFLWYTAEGNAAMAAATAVAIVPAAGSFIAKGTKQAIKAGKKAAQKAGEKAVRNATEKAAKKAAKKKLAKEAGKEAAEKGAEKAAKEAAEKATEKTAKEVTEKSAERTAKEAVEKGAKGGKKTKPDQVHHYATNKNKTYTPQLEEITKKYGLDLDDKWNKDLLPHQGRHPNAYHDYVLDNMQKFDRIANGDKTKFLKLYAQMKQKIINNPDMLYKDYWKK